jgi:hypothetical protein
MGTTFIAEIKDVNMKKLVSNDQQFSVRLVSEDIAIMALSAIGSETLVKVTVEEVE